MAIIVTSIKKSKISEKELYYLLALKPAKTENQWFLNVSKLNYFSVFLMRSTKLKKNETIQILHFFLTNREIRMTLQLKCRYLDSINLIPKKKSLEWKSYTHGYRCKNPK